MDRFHHSERYMAESVASRGLAIDCSGRPDLQFLHGSLQHAVGQGHQRGVALVFRAFFPPVSVPGRSFQGEYNNKQLFIRPLDLRYTHFLQVHSNDKRLFIRPIDQHYNHFLQVDSNNKQLFIWPIDLHYNYFLQVDSNNKQLFIRPIGLRYTQVL